jgi:D-beta-D-heptose 7-phosphate kinase/D-beta-D-heptose 1-phosphate adenosyltransferase
MRVLVIGDACIDEYRYGVINRVNPESTAPLLNFVKIDERLGMAYNVCDNLRSFGVEVDLVVPTEISRKVRYIDMRTGDHLLRVDEDVICESYAPQEVYDYDAIVISDYNKGFITTEAVKSIRSAFKGQMYMDTKKTDLVKFNGIMLKINELEYHNAQTLNDNYVVTRSAKGCIYSGVEYPVQPIEVVDVCGAGDVFLAAMVAEHLRTDNMSLALKYANNKAAESCTKLGTVCVS